MHFKIVGFTLIEVLVALAIVAISLTALLHSIGQHVSFTARIKDSSIRQWVSKDGATMIQLDLIQIPPNQTKSYTTKILNQNWYWRVTITPTAIKTLFLIKITTSKYQGGPYSNPYFDFKLKAA